MPAHIVRILLCAASTGRYRDMSFHRLSSIEEDALWKKIMKGEEENGSEMDWKSRKKVITLRGRNILVSAAAGSGKNCSAGAEDLSKIMDPLKPVDIDRLLIMTFTRAAAGEMRERIERGLDQALAEDPDNEHLQRQMTLIHTAQITTIDGFCAYVIRNYFHLIGLDPGYRTADEGELKLLQEDVLKELFEDHYAERKADFTAFVECYAPGKTDEGLKEHVLELYNAAMSNPWPEKWLDSCVENYHLDPEKGLEGTRWFPISVGGCRLRTEKAEGSLQKPQ